MQVLVVPLAKLEYFLDEQKLWHLMSEKVQISTIEIDTIYTAEYLTTTFDVPAPGITPWTYLGFLPLEFEST